jgi:CBS domain-containing protein
METLRAILEHKGRAIRTTSPSDQVLAAVDDMCRHHVGALLVMQGEEPVGIISERDLLRRVLLERRDPATTRVEEIMTREIVCVGLDVSPGEAMRVMTERRCRHLPVVVEGRVVGMVSIGDLVRAASDDHEYEIRMLHEYVSGRYPG